MKLRLLIAILLTCMLANPCLASTKSVAHNYVNLFNQAHKMNDSETKGKYYDLITNDTKILEHVKKEYPTTYTLIRLEKTKRRLEKMKFRFGDDALPSTSGVTARSTEGIGENNGLKSEKRAGTDNRKLANEFPNQSRPANRSNSGTSNSNVRSTNRDTVQAFPNQERVRQLSNQKRLRQQR